MEKAKLNFVVDTLMFLGMAILAGIGFLIKFVLLPGKERAIVYGSNVELYFLGLDRHEWGTFHLYVAYILIALLAVHIILHFKWIASVFTRFISNTKAKIISGIIFFMVCLYLALFPFTITPEVSYQRGDGEKEIRLEKENGKVKLKEKARGKKRY